MYFNCEKYCKCLTESKHSQYKKHFTYIPSENTFFSLPKVLKLCIPVSAVWLGVPCSPSLLQGWAKTQPAAAQTFLLLLLFFLLLLCPGGTRAAGGASGGDTAGRADPIGFREHVPSSSTVGYLPARPHRLHALCSGAEPPSQPS